MFLQRGQVFSQGRCDGTQRTTSVTTVKKNYFDEHLRTAASLF